MSRQVATAALVLLSMVGQGQAQGIFRENLEQRLKPNRASVFSSSDNFGSITDVGDILFYNGDETFKTFDSAGVEGDKIINYQERDETRPPTFSSSKLQGKFSADYELPMEYRLQIFSSTGFEGKYSENYLDQFDDEVS